MSATNGRTISSAYLETQRTLHADPHGYGGKGGKWAPAVAALLRDVEGTSLLDYGCGQGGLVRALRAMDLVGVRFAEFDPAIYGKNGRQSFADVVTCTDVLEHIEPEFLDTVLAELRGLARKAVFVVIATRPSNKTLSDGRNAHLIIESGEWWDARVRGAGFSAIAPAPPSPEEKPSREWVAVLRP